MVARDRISIISIPDDTIATSELICAHECLYQALDPENPPKILNMQAALDDPNTVMLVACDGRPPFFGEWYDYPREKYIGALTLTIAHTATRTIGRIEHLAVAPDWQRGGIGSRLVREACSEAEKRRACRIDLTSSSRRVGAQALYGSLGFCRRDTENWRLILKDDS